MSSERLRIVAINFTCLSGILSTRSRLRTYVQVDGLGRIPCAGFEEFCSSCLIYVGNSSKVGDGLILGGGIGRHAWRSEGCRWFVVLMLIVVQRIVRQCRLCLNL